MDRYSEQVNRIRTNLCPLHLYNILQSIWTANERGPLANLASTQKRQNLREDLLRKKIMGMPPRTNPRRD